MSARRGGRAVRAWRVRRYLFVPITLQPCRTHVEGHAVVDVARRDALAPRRAAPRAPMSQDTR